MGTRDVWHSLRGLRAEPPGEARLDDRAALFRAALEQAEQLAASAMASGYAARPIALYYMVNQAARAIVAAEGDVTKASGHGLESCNLDAGSLRDFVIRPRKGLIHALAEVVNRSSTFQALRSETTAADLWAYLPRCGTWAAQAGLADACALSIDSREGGPADDERVSVRVSGWPWTLDQVGSLTMDDVAERVEDLARTRYDVSPGWTICRTPSDSFFANQPLIHVDSKAGLFAVDFVLERHPRRLDSTIGEIRAWERFGIGHRSGGEEWVLPALRDGDRVHPLVAWYAVLYVFSMLARYEPVAWRQHLDVDRSPYAVALQRTLDLAIDDVPLLVQQALGIREFSAG